MRRYRVGMVALAAFAVLAASVAFVAIAGCGGNPFGSSGEDELGPAAVVGNMVVVGFNELGMHCMNRDFSRLMILPPFNTLRAQIIQRTGEDPQIVTSGVRVNYRLVGNTTSADKTNFWQFATTLLGFSLKPNVGLTGSRLSGQLRATGDGRYQATGLPVTPLMDNGKENPYPVATITVKQSTTIQAVTKAVVPVSWEISCNLCHSAPDGADMDILRAHDRLHGTDLVNQTPVACGRCHLQPPLAAVLGPGSPALPTLSRAMHGAHASRMGSLNLAVACYACHPGVRTQCLRDVHKKHGMVCTDCHGSMTAVASPTRTPWADEPRCGSCHRRTGYQFEEPGKLFKESRGHNGVYCTTCHNTPHAIVPTTTKADNLQMASIQGHAGTLNTCSVCHSQTPDEAFNHTLSD